MIRITFFGGSLMVNLSLPLKTPLKKQYVIRIAFSFKKNIRKSRNFGGLDTTNDLLINELAHPI